VVTDTSEAYIPTAIDASEDYADVYADGCHQSATEIAAEKCIYGKADAEFTVAVVGDSHAAQWVPSIQKIGGEENWRVETYTKSSCPLADVTVADGDASVVYDTCVTWNNAVLSELTGPEGPDMVITASMDATPVIEGSRTSGDARYQIFAAGLHRSWAALQKAGVPVVAIVDTPLIGIDVPECVISKPTELTDCAIAKSEALKGHGVAQKGAVRGLRDVAVVDMNDMICPEASCAPIIGGVLVYRDQNHITATYARTLSASLKERLFETGYIDAAPK